MKSGKVNALVGAAAAAGTNILTHMCVCIENRVDRLPELAAELARRQVAVIVTTGGTPPALAAMAATKTIPIVISPSAAVQGPRVGSLVVCCAAGCLCLYSKTQNSNWSPIFWVFGRDRTIVLTVYGALGTNLR
jgi:hypothetical protein